MSEKDIQGKTTLNLIREFVEDSKELRRCQLVPPEKARGWLKKRILQWKKGSLHKKLRKASDTLVARYEGVLYQLLRKSGVDVSGLKTVSSAIWVACQDRVVTLDDYRGFSRVLWEAYVVVAPTEARALRPKFMLRQLVDEMPSSDERGVLIDRAYDKNAQHSPPGTEVLRKLEGAYVMLHEEVLRHEDELDLLTDGELDAATIRSLQPPFVRYEEWIFTN